MLYDILLISHGWELVLEQPHTASHCFCLFSFSLGCIIWRADILYHEHCVFYKYEYNATPFEKFFHACNSESM